jgi:gamma-D-glutamyl-L-lysine dipeptidyl-peptidase
VSDPQARIRGVAGEVRAELVPDPRVEVFEVRTRPTAGGLTVHGVTTVPAAAESFRRRVDALGVDADVRIDILPDPSLRPASDALIRSPIAPVYSRPTMNSTQVSQYVLGVRVTLLSAHGLFYRVRGEDALVGWIHQGYMVIGAPDWALAWERAEHGEPVVSTGAEVHDEAGRTFARLPWGARVIQQSGGRILLPDGRTGQLGDGEVVAADRLWDRFPARGESIARTARRWVGAPYLWGGVTPHGVDCSGLVQSVHWIHGVALPRDSDMQNRVGSEIEPGTDFQRLRPGDLLFFSDKGRVNHVTLSLGGSEIIHASASNGVVDVNDVCGDQDVERLLHRTFVGARRLLPD